MKLTKIETISENDIGRFIILKDGFLCKVLTNDKAGILNSHRIDNPTIVTIHNNIKGFFVDDIILVNYEKGCEIITNNNFNEKALKHGDIVITEGGRIAVIEENKSELYITMLLINKEGIYKEPTYSFLISRNGLARKYDSTLSVQALIVNK